MAPGRTTRLGDGERLTCAIPDPWDPGLRPGVPSRPLAATAALGALATVWGLAVGSQMMLFDGSCAVVEILVGWLRAEAGSSYLLTVEAAAWRIETIGGVGMVAGLSVTGLLTGSTWDTAAAYVDPVMVLLMCLAFLMDPIKMVRTTVIELLERAPPESIRGPVLDAVAAVPEVTVAQEHAVRQDLQRRLDALPYDVWLNVELVPRPEAAATVSGEGADRLGRGTSPAAQDDVRGVTG
jgi:predicted Co/Zn/Cd cation transporter (cation efflux family)